MPSLRRTALRRSPRRRTVLRSAPAAVLAGIAGCSGMLSGNRPTDDGEDPTSATPADERTDDGDPTGTAPSVEDVEPYSPTPTVVLQNRIDGAASVVVAIQDGGETAFSTMVDVAAGGERPLTGFGLAPGEYTLRVARGRTSAAAAWEITGSEGPTPCSPSCLPYARLLPEEVDLFWVTLG